LTKQYTQHSDFFPDLTHLVFVLRIEHPAQVYLYGPFMSSWLEKISRCSCLRMRIALMVGYGWELVLKSNFEFYMLGVKGRFFDFSLSYIAGKGFFDVSNASGNVIGGALGKHLYSAVMAVTDKSG
jgi:hypothetical protein